MVAKIQNRAYNNLQPLRKLHWPRNMIYRWTLKRIPLGLLT